MQIHSPGAQTGRRGFIKQALAIILGGIAVLTPALAALFVLTDPLRRKSSAAGAIRVTSIAALPDDGIPRKFPVLAAKTDAWNKFVNVPVGAVYLRRTKDGKVEALNVVCPHAGCFVDFSAGQDKYICPCHNSSFKIADGARYPGSPSPRGMDSLAVEVRADGGVWVKFENFEAGRADKVPIA
jgi:menaquinol-cytochrome c reductase iron-sulfur subunit